MPRIEIFFAAFVPVAIRHQQPSSVRRQDLTARALAGIVTSLEGRVCRTVRLTRACAGNAKEQREDRHHTLLALTGNGRGPANPQNAACRSLRRPTVIADIPPRGK